MTTYRFWATHLITGAVLADNIPLTVSQMSRTISGVGQLTGVLNLQTHNKAQNQVYLTALEPRRTVLWASQDEFPVWAGIVWDWTHQSILDGTLPISASTFESLFSHRQIDKNLTYTGSDMFDIFRGLINFAVTKTPNGAVAGLQLPTNESGVTLSLNYLGTDVQKVWDALTALASTGNFEFTFLPGLDSNGNGIIQLQLGYPHIGQPITNSNIVLQYPGNVYDYAFPRTGSSSANSLIATAPPNGAAISWESQYPHGQDLVDLGEGYPLMEDSISYAGTGVTSYAQINAYVDGQLPLHTAAMEAPLVSLAPGVHPLIRELNLGDYAWFIATSPLHPSGPAGQPGMQQQGRITGWTCTPPGNNQQEVTKITLGGIRL